MRKGWRVPFPLYASFLCVWLLLIILFPKITHTQATVWYRGCITRYYGQGEPGGQEHGNDIACFPWRTPITALLSGVVTYAGYTSFGFYEVTWKLNYPSFARGSPYAYVEDMAQNTVKTGQKIRQGQIIGYSMNFVEFGLTPDWAYGISNWRWGVNSIFLINEARDGTLPREVPPTPAAPMPSVCAAGRFLSVDAAKACAYAAGFRGQQIAIIVAIARAESKLDTQAVGLLGELGVLQIYLVAHPEVSRACATNVLCSFQAAYQISKRGTDFTPWSTYDDGEYKQFL